MTAKERYHAAISGETVDRTPVTPIFMAWGAHYVGHSYRDYYLNADVMVKAHLALARDFGIDQVSTISDPWREAHGYGTQLDYPPEGVGVCQRHLFHECVDLDLIEKTDLRNTVRCADRIRAVKMLVDAVGDTHSVLGWVEGPLAEYVDLRNLEDALVDLYDDPETYHEAARLLVQKALEFAEPQVEIGADMIGIGDAAASLLSPEQYAEFVLPHEQALIRGIHAMGAKVKLHICGDTRKLVSLMAQTGADLIDLDYMVPIRDAVQQTQGKQAFAGNFNPVAELKDSSPERIRKVAQQCIEDGGARFVLQPGCEVPPGTPADNVRAFCPEAKTP